MPRTTVMNRRIVEFLVMANHFARRATPSSSPFYKNILIFRNCKSVYILAPSRSSRRGARDRHGRGAGCGGRGCADNERRMTRTAKSCGPDTSTPVSSSREASFLGATVTRKPDHRGELEAAVKTIACGNVGCSGVSVVTNACAFYFAHAAAGAWAPGIPHALFGRNCRQRRGRFAPRGRKRMSGAGKPRGEIPGFFFKRPRRAALNL